MIRCQTKLCAVDRDPSGELRPEVSRNFPGKTRERLSSLAHGVHFYPCNRSVKAGVFDMRARKWEARDMPSAKPARTCVEGFRNVCCPQGSKTGSGDQFSTKFQTRTRMTRKGPAKPQILQILRIHVDRQRPRIHRAHNTCNSKEVYCNAISNYCGYKPLIMAQCSR